MLNINDTRAVPSVGMWGGGGGAVAPLIFSDYYFKILILFLVAEYSHKYVYKNVLPPRILIRVRPWIPSLFCLSMRYVEYKLYSHHFV